MTSRLSRQIRNIFSIIWPKTCVLCNKALARGEDVLCLECLAEMPALRYDGTINHVGAPGNTIKVVSWFAYGGDDPSHRLIHDIKYHDRPKLARKLGREFAMQKLLANLDIDVILPIPLHWTKYAKRSYNQTREIARGINDVTKIHVADNLYALRSHPSQTHRDRSARMENVRDLFGVRRADELEGCNIALLDDVITTGATMISALEAILEQVKPGSVTFLSLARTHDGTGSLW